MPSSSPPPHHLHLHRLVSFTFTIYLSKYLLNHCGIHRRLHSLLTVTVPLPRRNFTALVRPANEASNIDHLRQAPTTTSSSPTVLHPAPVRLLTTTYTCAALSSHSCSICLPLRLCVVLLVLLHPRLGSAPTPQFISLSLPHLVTDNATLTRPRPSPFNPQLGTSSTCLLSLQPLPPSPPCSPSSPVPSSLRRLPWR